MYLVVVLAIVMSLDNLIIGIAYGTRNVKIPLGSNLLISIITGGATVLSAFGGSFLANIIHYQWAKYVGCTVTILIGMWFVIQEVVNTTRNASQKVGAQAQTGKSFVTTLNSIISDPFRADEDLSGHISLREALVLGTAMAINNIPVGTSAGISGLGPGLVAVSAVICSVVAIWLGISIGKFACDRSRFGKYASLSAGLLLISVGIMEFFN